MLEFLESREDLNLRIEACDAAVPEMMERLISSVSIPIAGCILLSTVLSDRIFSAHSQESFEAAYIPKAGAFKVLESICPVEKLDFVIALSSAAAFGNAGQTAYAR